MEIKKLIIRRPDDMHVHFRNGLMLQSVAPFTTRIFGRAVAMGNLPESVKDEESVKNYRKEILNASPDEFTPIMSVMLTKETTPAMIKEAHRVGAKVLKLIPGHTSTNSSEGISLEEIKNYFPVLKTARESNMIFSIHAELIRYPKTDKEIPEIEKENMAIPYIKRIVSGLPGLKIVVEHASTRRMIEFIKKTPKNIAATLTVHHALLNYCDVFDCNNGKIKNPFLYCKPVAKTENDKWAVIEAMTSGNPKFFFGSDSAPHPVNKKKGDNPPAGIFSAPVALPLLCEIFENEKELDKLENFVSKFGAEFYGLPPNTGKIKIEREEWRVPDEIGGIKIFKGDEKIQWQVV